MNLLRVFLNWISFFWVRANLSVDIKPGSQVSWSRLVSQRFGNLIVGRGSIVNCRIDFDGPSGQVSIGDRCFIGASHLVCRERITIGNDVVISWGVTVVDHNSHALEWEYRKNDVVEWGQDKKDWTHVAVRPLLIRDKVWIGFGATILKGVEVGEGAVIGAGAVVTKNVEAYTVVAGNPAKVVKRLKESVVHVD